MAKGRMLDRNVSESRKIARLPSDTERMAYCFLLPFTDREGRMEADAEFLAGKVFTRLPHMDAERVDACLQALSDVGLITLYAHGDITVMQFAKFLEFNTPHHKEPASKLPEPTEKAVQDAIAQRQAKHDASMGQASTDHESSKPIIKEKRTKGKGREEPLKGSSPSQLTGGEDGEAPRGATPPPQEETDHEMLLRGEVPPHLMARIEEACAKLPEPARRNQIKGFRQKAIERAQAEAYTRENNLPAISDVTYIRDYEVPRRAKAWRQARAN